MNTSLCFNVAKLPSHSSIIIRKTHYFIPNPVCRHQSKKNFSYAVKRDSRKAHFFLLSCSGIILNTKSGGHAFVGYYLAHALLQQKQVQVTLWNEGSEAQLRSSQPFSHYSELKTLGINTIFGQSATESLEGKVRKCDWIIDNFSKDVETTKPLVELASQIGVRHYLFVSSAGIYKASEMTPHFENDPVNSDAAISQTERFLLSQTSFAVTCFRPIYLIGLKSAKTSYTDYFFDRIIRGLKVPIPYPGDQLVSLSHVDDLVQMIILSIDKSDAFQEIFNATSGKFITVRALAELCSQVCCKPLQTFYYDAGLASNSFSRFPFRNRHFIADPRKAEQLLGWSSHTNLEENIAQMFSEYLSLQKDKQNFPLDEDHKLWEVMSSISS
ncbi:Chloroplast stem-loop binding protein of 41 kDa a, chloroplastic [Galdieria sulphuraria]|uniref:mRNA binding / poly(U) binding protein n=1 Tax=Galdieria sulphuraria TaxID=130081 RepID=M2WZD4_GALSU|nr:mRNA binding / poly(U) binding protein [Galdieria sulphuraria]EME29440.1 mRNA binding / poly(U) binding protein [Galdieria sulphuraria]GJD06044.1 Chloroplast stem-loop binding protein of 41 kDa a, chloroplastic [Galdieria sulphuraria]|eukprot:XP_005705960.1 mRNA binding / poly(U) binding protein [Galdieria sulphuraria]